MELVIHVALAFLVASVATVRSDPDMEKGDLKSEAARQKIYEIISSHEDRKYGDHGGHEYEEGEVPRKSGSRKYNKRYGYQPDEGNYYYVEQQQHPKQLGYQPKAPVAENVYVVPKVETTYKAPLKRRYPVLDPAFVEPIKKEYLSHDTTYAVPKRPEAVYVVPKVAAPPKEHVYREHVGGGYIDEDKTAPITIGKTARTVYPKPLGRIHQYPVVDAKHHPSEYMVLEGQKPPRPLILDPKLKAKYQHHQPEAHYSAPEHQVVLKPELAAIPVHHYPAPIVKDYGERYGDHHKAEEKGHHASGHGYYDEGAVKKESGHKAHGHHDIAGHKAHSSAAAHHDEHGHHHNRGLYERDRGYHYEKAYAYDRVRAHHDIGSNHGAHSSYGAHQGQEAHKDAGHHGAETYSYFKKDDHGAGYGYHDGNSLYKKGQDNYGHKYIPTYYHG